MEVTSWMKRGITLGLIILVAFLLTPGCLDTKSVVVTEHIVSLDRSNAIDGSFYLGSGTIEGRPSYSYYVLNSDGGYKLKSVSADICTVYRDEDKAPYIVAGYKKASPFQEQSYTSEHGNIGDRWIQRKYGDDITYTTYILNSEVYIHIPRDSKIGGFNP